MEFKLIRQKAESRREEIARDNAWIISVLGPIDVLKRDKVANLMPHEIEALRCLYRSAHGRINSAAWRKSNEEFSKNI